VQSQATSIAMSGGALLLSDELASLQPEHLRIAETLLPLIGQRPVVSDWLDSRTPHRLRLDLENVSGKWHLLALFNWEDGPRDLSLKPSDYHLDNACEYIAREFWSGQVYYIPRGKLALAGIPAHGVVLIALRQDRPDESQYLGSDLHVSQGLEVGAWKPSDHGLSLRLERPGRVRGSIYLRLPSPPTQLLLNNEPIEWQLVGEGVYRLGIEASQTADVKLEWGNLPGRL
jgi:alpha-galactosidase